MHFDLGFHYDGNGWQVRGLAQNPGFRFADLADALDYAKRQCGGEPAAIELFVNGVYVVTAFQDRGWPRELFRPSGCQCADSGHPSGRGRSGKILKSARQRWLSLSTVFHRRQQVERSAEQRQGANLSTQR